jgi:hypothetical protein
MRCCEFFIELMFLFIGISIPVVLNKINLQRWIVVLIECLSLVLMFVVFVFLREKGVISQSEICIMACVVAETEVDYRMRKSANGEVSLIRLFIEGICFLFLLKAIDILIDIG